jgi:uncharacterized protein YbaR (Trm112 family)
MGFNRCFFFVYDGAKYRADFVLVCPRCKHRVVIERETLLAILRALEVNPDVAVAGGKLRCTACRKRGCILEITREGSLEALRLGDDETLPHKGLRISITQWLKMPEAERRRMRRALQ